MYDYVKGKLIEVKKLPDGVFMTVENAGIGYLIRTSERTLKTPHDEDVTVYLSLIHRENSMSFCGFFGRLERDMFELLQTASGVGVKAALAIIDEFSTEDLIGIIANSDYKMLSRAKGIGEKSAKKIVTELYDKVLKNKNLYNCEVSAVSDKTGDYAQTAEILSTLGYSREEIKNALAALPVQIDSDEEILAHALKFLAQ